MEERRLEGKRSLVRSRHRLQYNIKIYLRNMEWGFWAGLIWLGIGAGECGNEPSGFIKCGVFLN